MKEKIKKIIDDSPYDIGVYISTTDEVLFSWNQDREYESASCIELFILVEYYRQVSEGIISEDDLLSYQKEDAIFGLNTGIISLLHYGIQFSTKDLAVLMITRSDNIATNKLIELLGIDNINKTIHDLGFVKTRLHCPLDLLKYLKFGTTTPYEYAKAYQMILNEEMINQDISSKCLSILKKQDTLDMLQKGLPAWDFVARGTEESDIFYIASKCGIIVYNDTDMPNVRNDGGIISTKYGDYILSIFISQVDDLRFDYDNKAIELGGKIGECAYEEVRKRYQKHCIYHRDEM